MPIAESLIRKLFNPDDNPLYSSAPQDPTQTAPQPSVAAPDPGAAPPRGMISSAMAPPESRDQYLSEHPPAIAARPTGDFDTGQHPTLRHALASLFAGMSEFGRPGSGTAMVNRWANQEEAKREYDQNLPTVKQEAGNKAYENYLGEQGKKSTIEEQGAQTENLRENSPAAQRKAQFLSQLQTDAESGKYDAASLKAKYLRVAQYNRVNVAPEEIDMTISGTKPIGAKYTVIKGEGGRPEGLQDRTGKQFTPAQISKDLVGDPEAQSLWTAAQQGHQQERTEKVADQQAVANAAADRQAAAFAQQQKMDATKRVNDRVDTALDADQRLSRMEKAYTKAQKGDQQAMLSLLTDHIGMTLGMQKGARITKDILNEAQDSQPWLAKIGAKFDSRGLLSGATLGPDQMRQMLDLGYDARGQAYQSAHDTAKSYDVPLPKGMENVERKRVTGAKPLIEQQGGEAPTATGPNGHKIKVVGGKWVDATTGKPI